MLREIMEKFNGSNLLKKLKKEQKNILNDLSNLDGNELKEYLNFLIEEILKISSQDLHIRKKLKNL